MATLTFIYAITGVGIALLCGVGGYVVYICCRKPSHLRSLPWKTFGDATARMPLLAGIFSPETEQSEELNKPSIYVFDAHGDAYNALRLLFDPIKAVLVRIGSADDLLDTRQMRVKRGVQCEDFAIFVLTPGASGNRTNFFGRDRLVQVSDLENIGLLVYFVVLSAPLSVTATRTLYSEHEFRQRYENMAVETFRDLDNPWERFKLVGRDDNASMKPDQELYSCIREIDQLNSYFRYK